MGSNNNKEGNGSLIAVALIIVGLFVFLYGLICKNTNSTSKLILGFIATSLVLLGSGLLLYDRVFEPPRKYNRLDSVSVKVSKANVRSSPSLSSKDNIIDQTQRGTDFKVLEKHKGWAKIEFNSQPAYISLSIMKKYFVKERKPYRWPYMWWWFGIFVFFYIACVISAVTEK